MKGERPKVVVVGAGFGGLTTVQALARVPVTSSPCSSGRDGSDLPSRHCLADRLAQPRRGRVHVVVELPDLPAGGTPDHRWAR